MDTITLDSPVMIDGREVHELTWDDMEITAEMFARADALKSRAGGTPGMGSKAIAETDYGFHTYLGYMAILAVNPGYDLKDLERIKGRDIIKIMRIGRNFTMGRSVEHSDQSDSGVPSETMPEPSTPVLETSEAEDS